MLKLKVREILLARNKSAYWLAKQTGISLNSIGKICRCQTVNIKFDTLEKICKALECTPNDIVVDKIIK